MWFTLSLTEKHFKIVETKGCSAVLCLGTDLACNVATLTASSNPRFRARTPDSIFYCLEIPRSSCDMLTVPSNCWKSIVGNDHAKLWERNTALEGIQKLFQEVQLGFLALLFSS